MIKKLFIFLTGSIGFCAAELAPFDSFVSDLRVSIDKTSLASLVSIPVRNSEVESRYAELVKFTKTLANRIETVLLPSPGTSDDLAELYRETGVALGKIVVESEWVLLVKHEFKALFEALRLNFRDYDPLVLERDYMPQVVALLDLAASHLKQNWSVSLTAITDKFKSDADASMQTALDKLLESFSKKMKPLLKEINKLFPEVSLFEKLTDRFSRSQIRRIDDADWTIIAKETHRVIDKFKRDLAALSDRLEREDVAYDARNIPMEVRKSGLLDEVVVRLKERKKQLNLVVAQFKLVEQTLGHSDPFPEYFPLNGVSVRDALPRMKNFKERLITWTGKYTATVEIMDLLTSNIRIALGKFKFNNKEIRRLLIAARIPRTSQIHEELGTRAKTLIDSTSLLSVEDRLARMATQFQQSFAKVRHTEVFKFIAKTKEDEDRLRRQKKVAPFVINDAVCPNKCRDEYENHGKYVEQRNHCLAILVGLENLTVNADLHKRIDSILEGASRSVKDMRKYFGIRKTKSENGSKYATFWTVIACLVGVCQAVIAIFHGYKHKDKLTKLFKKIGHALIEYIRLD